MVAVQISLAGRVAPPPISMRTKSTSVDDPAVIVFGRDEAGKPHASCFGNDDAELARKAADLMDYYALDASADGIASIVAALPAGRVFASGRAFVPFVKASVFEALAAAAGVPADSPAPRPKVDAQKPAAGATAVAASAPRHAPPDWSQIKVGSVVLASEGQSEGWFEAVVVELKSEDQFIVKWRDWPDEPMLLRHRNYLGLLHPSLAAA